MENYQGYYPNSMYQYPAYTPSSYTPTYAGRFGQAGQNALLPPAGASQPMAALGKIVDGIEAVKAADIPMDGKMYYFPKADGGEVYAKRWMEDGTTRILRFRAEGETEKKTQEVDDVSLPDEASERLMGRFDVIEEKIEKLERALKGIKAPASRAKREDETK